MKILPRCYVFCLLLLLIAGTGGRKALRSADKHNVSSLAMTHVINQAEPFCRELLPEHETLRFLAYPTPAFHKNGTVRHLWNVDCQDAQGNRLVYVLWDEDQRQLVQIGRSYYHTHPYTGVIQPPEPRISDTQAECTAREWVVRLHLATGDEVQKQPEAAAQFRQCRKRQLLSALALASGGDGGFGRTSRRVCF